MTIETLEKRIAGKQKAIDQLNKKIARIEAAKASNWEKNPYYYNEHDLRIAQKELTSAQQSLSQYEDQLNEAFAKANSRDIKAINSFLDSWESSYVEWMKEQKIAYDEALKDYHVQNKELTDRINNRIALKLSLEEISKLRASVRSLRETFKRDWSHVTQFSRYGIDWHESMKKAIHEERLRKYDDLVDRVVKITGEITDAEGLYIDQKLNLNGIIIGKNGKAEVHTIGAGGYNIMRFHYRTLIHELH